MAVQTATPSKILGRGSPLKIVKIGNLQVDPSYQRPIKRPWVRWLVANWSWPKAGLITLSLRTDGSLWILEGQHRVEALKMRGEAEAPAYIMQGLSLAEEADIYLGRATHLGVTPLGLFKARVKAGEELAVNLTMIVKEAGFEIGLNPTDIRAPGTLEAIYLWEGGGPQIVRQTLHLIQAAWGGKEKDANNQVVILGIAAFLKVYPDVDQTRLQDRMRNLKPAELLEAARSQARYGIDKRVWAWIVEILHTEYAKGMGTRLPEKMARKPVPRYARRSWLQPPVLAAKKGERTRQAERYAEIVKLRDSGMTFDAIAEQFKITRDDVARILRRKSPSRS